MEEFSLGSIWRKWDLHFHTPSSFDYENDTVSDEQITDVLIDAGVKVVGITDHHFIDVKRIKNIRKLSKGKFCVIPGIELRSELGDKPIHYIGLFSESMDLDHIWDTLKGALKLTPEGIKARGGNESVYVPISDAHKIISGLGGLISIHAGGKSNSVEGIENREQFQQRIKFDITKMFIDFLEIGQLKDIERYIKIVFPATGLNLPIIIGSDNHNVNDYGVSLPCWLKADATFYGLRQVVNEPIERVFLGERPQILDHVEKNKTKYIDSLKIKKRSSSSLGEDWFDGVSLEFNFGLISIIGNKGNGKSALSDVIGLMGNCPHEESFSFLHEDQFRHPRANKSSHFDAELTWKSGETIRRNLDDRFDSTLTESVRYIPQFYLEDICDELKGGQEGRFHEELKQVIFSRIPTEERLGKASLDELVEFRTTESQAKIRQIIEDLRRETLEVVKLEEKSTDIYIDSLKSELRDIEKEIDAHKSIMPVEVKKPETDPKRKKEIDDISNKIEEYASQIVDVDKDIKKKQDELNRDVLSIRLIEKIYRKIGNFKLQVDNLFEEISTDCEKLGISKNDLIQVNIDLSKLKKIEKNLHAKKDNLDIQLKDEDNDQSLIFQRKKIKNKIDILREKLDRPNKEYQRYLAIKAKWEEQLKNLIGNVNTPKTLEHYKALQDEIERIPEKLSTAKKKQQECAKRIFQVKKTLLRVYEELYAPIQEFIDKHPLAKERFGLEFRVSLVPRKFSDRFLEFINQQRRGSFHGESEGKQTINHLVAAANLDEDLGVEEFINKVIEYLHHDYRYDENPPVLIKDQVRQTFSPGDLYLFIYGLDYLEPRYVLRWEGKPLEQLSPGERGTLLLIFYLLIDNSMLPLIIDQPEGNLDNQTVYQLLVDCIKEAKKKRQIIIVTHNPNLAVVCDAEQVIYASLDKEGNYNLDYISGALENPNICKKIVDVLEGTKPAIDNRVAKYRIIFNS